MQDYTKIQAFVKEETLVNAEEAALEAGVDVYALIEVGLQVMAARHGEFTPELRQADAEIDVALDRVEA